MSPASVSSLHKRLGHQSTLRVLCAFAVRLLCRLEQLADNLASVGKLYGTANRGLVFVSKIETDAIVDRGYEVFHLVWVFGHFRGFGVRFTQNLATLYSAPSEHDCKRLRPVVTPSVRIHFGCTAEFSHHYDQ